MQGVGQGRYQFKPTKPRGLVMGIKEVHYGHKGVGSGNKEVSIRDVRGSFYECIGWPCWALI